MRGAWVIALLVWGIVPAGAGPLGGLGLPGLPNVPGTLNTVTGTATNTLDRGLNVVRDSVGRPTAPRAFEKDANGFRVVRGEVLALSPDAASLAAVRALNFNIVRQEQLPALGLNIAVLGVPDGMSAGDALTALRKADPAGAYDLNHIYDPSGTASEGGRTAAGARGASAKSIRIGMIDGGFDQRHEAFSQSTIVSGGCTPSSALVATAHGTAVASLLVGSDEKVSGALPGATLFAADVYCGQSDGGSAEAIARALSWLAENDVAVVNVSLSGPPNAVLETAVNAFVKRGRVIVAAVGNDGPAAPVEYPAGYSGVAGVTSVDANFEIQVEANRGPDVAFAARGVDVTVAGLRGSHATMTGTSFAAPIVAARFALLMSRADARAASQAWAALEHAAIHLGSPGRNDTFGYGFLDGPAGAANTSAAK